MSSTPSSGGSNTTPPAPPRQGTSGKHWTDYVVSIASACAAVASAIAAGISSCQVKEMKAEQRAWIFPEKIEAESVYITGDEVHVPIKIYYRNAGRAPATIAFPLVHIYPIPESDLHLMSDKQIPPYCKGIGVAGVVNDMSFPGESAPGEFNTEATTKGDENRVEETPIPSAQRVRLILSGCIKYFSEGDPNPHFTGIRATLVHKDKQSEWDIRSQYPTDDVELIGEPFGHYAN